MAGNQWQRIGVEGSTVPDAIESTALFVHQSKAPVISRRQSGFSLLLMLILLAATVTTIMVTQLQGRSQKIKYDQQTTAVLAQAKAALLAYAAANPLQSLTATNHENDYLMWVLPCPDTGHTTTSISDEGDETGSCAAANVSKVGRLPWKSLKASVLRDGDNECLWYAVSGAHKSSPLTKFTTMINEDTPALLNVVDENGNFLGGAGVGDEVIAVIFAPGSVINAQNRSPDATKKVAHCGGNYIASNYLDNFNNGTLNINNASINTSAFGLTTLIQASQSQSFNDRLITITRSEVYAAIAKRKDFVPSMTTIPQTNLTAAQINGLAPIIKGITETLANCVLEAGGIPVVTGGIPTATSVNLGNTWSDYANINNYVPASGLFSGRFPAQWFENITKNSAITSNSKTNCKFIPPIDTLYEHWKDHFFYSMSTAAPTGYAAKVTFSGLRLSNQTREGTSLSDINQYLEGNLMGTNDVSICVLADLSATGSCP